MKYVVSVLAALGWMTWSLPAFANGSGSHGDFADAEVEGLLQEAAVSLQNVINRDVEESDLALAPIQGKKAQLIQAIAYENLDAFLGTNLSLWTFCRSGRPWFSERLGFEYTLICLNH